MQNKQSDGEANYTFAQGFLFLKWYRLYMYAVKYMTVGRRHMTSYSAVIGLCWYLF